MSEEMMGDFQVEASELLDEAEDSLLSLDKGEDFKNSYNNLFRAFHSIKGAAGMFGIEDLQAHMHHLESLLSSKQAQKSFSHLFIDYLLDGVDCARKILAGQKIDFKQIDPDLEQTDVNPDEEALKEHHAKVEKHRDSLNSKSKGFDGEVWAVDDEPGILEIIIYQLEKLNYKLRAFTNPLELLEALEQGAPDLIISDIQMPELNGVQLVQRVNQKRPHLPVVILSGFVTKDVCIEVLAGGVAGILEKPIESQRLSNVVQVNVNRYQNLKLLNKSVDLLIFQFENFPRNTQEEVEFYERYKQELKLILERKNELYSKLR